MWLETCPPEPGSHPSTSPHLTYGEAESQRRIVGGSPSPQTQATHLSGVFVRFSLASEQPDPAEPRGLGSAQLGTVTQAGAGRGSGGVWLLVQGVGTGVCHCSPGLVGQGRDANPPQKWHLWASHLWKGMGLVASWTLQREGWPTTAGSCTPIRTLPGKRGPQKPTSYEYLCPTQAQPCPTEVGAPQMAPSSRLGPVGTGRPSSTRPLRYTWHPASQFVGSAPPSI